MTDSATYLAVIFLTTATLIPLLRRLLTKFSTSLRRKATPVETITDPPTARHILQTSSLTSRARPNARLIGTFGICNPFTHPDKAYRNAFHGVVQEGMMCVEWRKVARMAGQCVAAFLAGNKGECDTDGIATVSVTEMVRCVCWDVVVGGLVGYDLGGVDGSGTDSDLTGRVTHAVDRLWRVSKGEKIGEGEELKRVIEEYFARVEGFGRPKPVEMLRSIAMEHEDGRGDKTSPLNLIIPAYETLWRVILFAILELQIRPFLASHPAQCTHTPSTLTADDCASFLANPTGQSLRTTHANLHNTLREILRLYPPTKHIHREVPNPRDSTRSQRRHIDIEHIHRDAAIWGPTSHCIAQREFAPMLVAIFIAAFVSRVRVVDVEGEVPE
ncbi:hypothetical protein HK104_003316, partial [Borealophlyctis nickersoniae]